MARLREFGAIRQLGSFCHSPFRNHRVLWYAAMSSPTFPSVKVVLVGYVPMKTESGYLYGYTYSSKSPRLPKITFSSFGVIRRVSCLRRFPRLIVVRMKMPDSVVFVNVSVTSDPAKLLFRFGNKLLCYKKRGLDASVARLCEEKF